MCFAWSLNGERRHLTHAQKTIVALELLPELEAEARKRQATSTGGADPPLRTSISQADHHGKAVTEAAAIVGAAGLILGGSDSCELLDPGAQVVLLSRRDLRKARGRQNGICRWFESTCRVRILGASGAHPCVVQLAD